MSLSATLMATPRARSQPATVRAAARSTTWVVPALFALALVPYLNVLQNDFTLDDTRRIVENPVVTDPVDALQVFATPVATGSALYRPLMTLTFALNERLAAGNPVGFHFVNLLLHAAVTVLVFLLGARLFGSPRPAAVVAAALFAVHPVHTEAVTNVVGRAELLAAMFGLLALLGVAGAENTRSTSRRRGCEFGSLLCFLLALLSKESAATVLPLLPLLRIALRREDWSTGLRRELRSPDWIPYCLCLVGFIYVRWLVVGGLGDFMVSSLDNVLAFVPWTVRVRTALAVVWDYFGLLVAPVVLSADYSYAQVLPVRSWIDPRALGGLALLVLAAAVLLRNRRPAFTFAAIFPLVTIALTGNLLLPIGTVKGERLLYFPSVGWVLLIGYAADRLLGVPRYRRLTIAGLALVTVAYGGRTWVRNRDWRNNATLFRSMGRTAPDSAKALYLSGLAAMHAGDERVAAAAFQRALQVFPWTGGESPALALGLMAERHGQVERALQWYRRALQINPGFRDGHFALCHALLGAGRFTDAATACRDGLRYTPADADLLRDLGYSLTALGARAAGTAVLQRALLAAPGDAVLRAHLARWSGRTARGAIAGRTQP